MVVGGDGPAEQVAGAFLGTLRRQDRDHLYLGREGGARHLLLDQGGVVHAVAASLPALPEPEAGDARPERSQAEEGGLQGLPALHPSPSP